MPIDQQSREMTEIRKRHSERRRKQIRKMKIRRTIFFTCLALIAVMIIMFYTPIFKIRSIEIEGNQKTETSAITECMGDIVGKNLFRTKISALKNAVSEIPYVQSVEIDRKVLRSKLVVTISECEEAASIASGDGYIIIDAGAKILENVAEKPENIPEVTGLNVANINVGEQLKSDDTEKFEIALRCLEEMKKIDILQNVRSISVEDISNITFNYDDRLDVLCGSGIELEKKLAFFKSAINSNRLPENPRGTMDMTTVGKAMYNPG